MEDSQITNLYWRRDESAIAETRSKYSHYCYAIASNILHNNEDSEETVNDTYIGAWNAMPPSRPAILSTFLGKITVSCLTFWRAKPDLYRLTRQRSELTDFFESLLALFVITLTLI